VCPEVHLLQAADAEKLADRELDVRARDGLQSAARVVEQSADPDAAAAVPAPCKPDAGLSAAQSFAVLGAALGELVQLEQTVWLQLLEVQMPEAHSLAQREQQEPARRAAQADAQQLMRA
jgi:hypothetical protein